MFLVREAMPRVYDETEARERKRRREKKRKKRKPTLPKNKK